MKTLLKAIRYPNKVLLHAWVAMCPYIKSDKIYLQGFHLFKFCKPLHVSKPKRFNEKLTWLKLHYKNQLLPKLVDKHAVKDYVKGIIGEEYIIPTLGVWDSVEAIDWENLPQQFVLKCTHDSGGVIVCRDKSKLDIQEAKEKLSGNLKKNFYLDFREWPYKHVKPRIIAEKYMQDGNEKSLKDYKFFCFNGEPKVVFIATDRDIEVKLNFFDMGFNPLNITHAHPRSEKPFEKPSLFEEMKQIAAKLAKGFPFARIDLYEINNRIYFGEYTFFPGGGMDALQPEEWDYRMGEWIDISQIKE